MISLRADRKSQKAIASLVAAAWSAVVSKGCRVASLFASESAFLRKKVIIITHYSLFITNLFLLACSGSSDSDEPQKPVDGPSVLDIYVYAPGQAVPTRANEGEVNADSKENAINLLQIWLFTHDNDQEKDDKLVTYFETTSFMDTSSDGVNKFELPIPDWFTDASPRPNVDVYVLANISSRTCGMSFDQNTEIESLEAAVLKYDGTAGTDYFGLTAPVTEVPSEGLPMSGVLRDQQVTGDKPVLTLRPPASSTEMAKVKLARAVSRIRFVFSCSTDFDGLKVNSVTLGNEMIPNEEYLFLQEPEAESSFGNPYDYKDNDFNIGTNYNIVDNEHPAPSLFSIDATAQCEDPAHYAWDRLMNDEKAKKPSITDQELVDAYEKLINEGLSSNVAPTYSTENPSIVIDPGHELPRLTEQRIYLRESDKQLTGTIKYQVKEKGEADYGEEKSIAFSMDAAGDFSRNHTWIVYSYLSWAKIYVVAVTIKSWTDETGGQTLYNW